MKTPSLFITLLAGLVILALWGANWGLFAVELGRWSAVVTIVIASAQVLVGALIFMELMSASASTVLSFLAGIAMFCLLTGFIVADVATRPPAPQVPPRPTHPTTLPQAR